jgi:hypothetical protein
MIEPMSILDVKLIFQLPIQSTALIGRGKPYFIRWNFLAAFGLVQLALESFGFLFVFFGFLSQFGIV